MDSLVIHRLPRLRSPSLVAGFAGWANAGEVSTASVGYLRDKLRARKFAEIRSDDFYDFSRLRPFTSIEDGLMKGLSWPANEFFYWKNRKSGHDLAILIGVEPHVNWRGYVEAVLQLAQRLKVARLYTVGGFYDKVPHTAEPTVSAVVSDPKLLEELKRYSLDPVWYEGPSALHTALQLICQERGIDSIGLWGRAPHYLPVRNARVCHGVLRKLTQMLAIDIGLKEIEKEAAYLEQQVAKALDQNPELRDYVKELQEGYRPAGRPAPGLGRLIGEVEEFLRHQQRGQDSTQ